VVTIDSIVNGQMPKEEKLKLAAKLIISASGRDPADEGLRGTPDRFAAMFMEEFFNGDPPEEAIKQMIMEESYDDLALVTKIPISSFCEHHMLPWHGRVAFGYIPEGRSVGLSKMTRMVTAASRGLTIQERVTNTLARVFNEEIQPKGVMVVIKAQHSCTLMRGVKSEIQEFTTASALGAFREDSRARSEFLSLIERS
jgi:GTP cyclohydrolase IA